jgi:hypothetical protein
MPKKESDKQFAMKRTEEFVRRALAAASRKAPKETTVRAVAKKVAKALPQHA